jgi:hypothetical protein
MPPFVFAALFCQVLDLEATEEIPLAQREDVVDGLRNGMPPKASDRPGRFQLLDDGAIQRDTTRLGFICELGLELGLSLNLSHLLPPCH